MVGAAMSIDLTATSLALLTFFGIYAIIALSLNLEYGLAGVPNFGQAMFVSIGAYTAGLTYTRLLPFLVGQPLVDPCDQQTLVASLQMRTGIFQSNPIVALFLFGLTVLIAMVVGGVVGFLVSYTVRRVKEEWYLGLVLLVGSEVFRTVALTFRPLVCGVNGISGIAQPFSWLDSPTAATTAFAALVVLIAFVVYAYCERLVRTPFGRVLKAMRENESVVLGLGKPVPRVRARVMFIGSALAALGGVLFAANLGFVSTNDYMVGMTLDVWVMVVLGGVGNNRGALLGALVVTLLNRFTAIASILLNSMNSPFEFNYARYILFGGILLWVVRYRQQGLLPEQIRTTVAHEELSLSK
jgi:branched-chain amino acid transport system permease protein